METISFTPVMGASYPEKSVHSLALGKGKGAEKGKDVLENEND